MRQLNSFYSFFYTHLSQEFNQQQGVQRWIEPIRPNSSLKPESGVQNEISFLISGAQPEGELNITVDKGLFLLDCSSTEKLNNSELRADVTVQPVSNFLATLSTPVNPSRFSKSYFLDGLNLQFANDYPKEYEVTYGEGVYPYQVTKTENYLENPWFSEPFEFSKPLPPGPNLIYELLTVDSDLIKLSDSLVQGDLSGLSLTADRTLMYKSSSDPDVISLDLIPTENIERKVVAESIPEGLIILDWVVDNLSVSRSYIPQNGRGYLPNSFLVSEMSQASPLRELSVSLIYLLQEKDYSLVLSTLTELTHIYFQTKVRFPGLPSSLSKLTKSSTVYLDNRNTLDQSWLGYALCLCVKEFRSKSFSQLIELPVGFTEFLDNLVFTVCSAIDKSTGEVYEGFDEFGYLVPNVDLSASVMSQLFLHQYLSFSYDLQAHQCSARVYSRLLELSYTAFDPSRVTISNISSSYSWHWVYKLYWNLVQDRHSDSNELLEYSAVVDPAAPSLSSFDYGLWVTCVTKLETLNVQSININYSTLVTPFVNLAPGLFYRSTYNKVPEFSSSTWVPLLESLETVECLLFRLPDFKLSSADAELLQTLTYAESKRMMPYGYKWSSEDSLSAYVGKIGSLLYGSSSLSFSWYLLFQALAVGLHLHNAQGWVLDYWGLTLGYPRPYYQTDNSYRQLLLARLTTNRSSLQAINNLLGQYGLDSVVWEPHIYSYGLDEESVLFNGTAEQLSSINGTTTIVSRKPWYPYSGEFTEQITLWSETAPRLVVYTNQVCPELTEELITSLSASVGLDLFSRQFSYDSVRTFAADSTSRIPN